ncbi:MAG TPA: response regulator [Saprospiraceae bacterium]|nr:response regulator [Saprospiraceae bacterium]
MGKKILIIEDNQEVKENLIELLTLSSYEVIGADNGKEGLQLAISEKPDLILCDVMMPELDGYGVIKVLNTNPTTSDIPVIFLTAKSEKSDLRKGMGMGAADYITKPFDDLELLDAIEIRLSKSEKIRLAFDRTDDGFQKFINEAKALEEFTKLSEKSEYRKYRKKDIIYEAGQYPKWIYFVTQGKIKQSYTNEFGKELITNIYSDGDFFGYISLLKNEKYSHSTITLEDSTLRLIAAEDFNLLLYNNRNFSSQFIKILANKYDDSEKQLLELAYSSVRKKVANALLLLCQKEKSNSFSILREDLAGIAGTAKETVIRTVSDFKAEGILDIVDNQIMIVDKKALERMPQ